VSIPNHLVLMEVVVAQFKKVHFQAGKGLVRVTARKCFRIDPYLFRASM